LSQERIESVLYKFDVVGQRFYAFPVRKESRTCHPDGHVHEFSKKSCEKLLNKMNFSIISSKVIYFSSDHERKNPLIGLRWFLDDKLNLLVPNFAHRIFGGCLIAFLGIDDDQGAEQRE
jgi:hypothetical protein